MKFAFLGAAGLATIAAVGAVAALATPDTMNLETVSPATFCAALYERDRDHHENLRLDTLRSNGEYALATFSRDGERAAVLIRTYRGRCRALMIPDDAPPIRDALRNDGLVPADVDALAPRVVHSRGPRP